jgi:hypothetical protein
VDAGAGSTKEQISVHKAQLFDPIADAADSERGPPRRARI